MQERRPVTWDYDDVADTLYVSFGEPQPALTLDLGNGFFARYLPESGELVGFTIVSLSQVTKRKSIVSGQ